MAFARVSAGPLFVALGAAGLLLTPALAGAQQKRKPSPVALSFDPISSFTPATADPRLAASLRDRGTSLTDLKFTPAPAKGRPSQLRVAIRARAGTPVKGATATAASSSAASPVSALTPTSYNLGVAVGWRRFAISGEVRDTESVNPALGDRESAVVGVSYSLSKRLSGRVAVAADRADNDSVTPVRRSDNYSVDVGGAYALNRRVAVTGGVRYQIDHDRLSTLSDDRRDSQAVYVGTAFKF